MPKGVKKAARRWVVAHPAPLSWRPVRRKTSARGHRREVEPLGPLSSPRRAKTRCPRKGKKACFASAYSVAAVAVLSRWHLWTHSPSNESSTSTLFGTVGCRGFFGVNAFNARSASNTLFFSSFSSFNCTLTSLIVFEHPGGGKGARVMVTRSPCLHVNCAEGCADAIVTMGRSRVERVLS